MFNKVLFLRTDWYLVRHTRDADSFGSVAWHVGYIGGFGGKELERDDVEVVADRELGMVRYTGTMEVRADDAS